jgi:hypothetical protein
MEGQDSVQEKEQVNTVPETEVKTEKTYTQDEFAKMQSTFEKKAKQAEREAQEFKKQVEATSGNVTSMQEQISKLTSEIERRELEGLEDLPQAQKLLRLQHDLRSKEADLLRQRSEFSKVQETAKEGLKFKDALALSKEYDIEVDELMECNTMADMYKKTLQLTKEKVKTPEKKELKTPSHIDSAVTSAAGKGRIWKASEITSMNSDDRFAQRSEISKAMREGRIDNTK